MLRDSILAKAVHLSVGADPEDPMSEAAIFNALQAVRLHLGMEIGFVSEFLGEERVFRHVDSSLSDPPFRKGHRLSMEEGYCRKVVNGELPELIPDTSLFPTALDIPETGFLPIGSHMSVPIRLSDGSVYGTFCCFSSLPDTSLCVRDLQTMRAVAEMVAAQIDVGIVASRNAAGLAARVRSVLAEDGPRIVYQPIVNLHDMSIVGTEALSRFDGLPVQGPDAWFADADRVGLRTELETAALHNALLGYADFWKDRWYLALNISPKTILCCDMSAVFSGFPLDRIVLELTEHEQVEDYDALASRLAGLRARGLRIAVDDAGSGYASLRHVLNLRPDILKLDISLTRGIDFDPVRRALGAAIVGFAKDVGCQVVAEGIETEAQMASLINLGINLGQGYLTGKPMPREALGGVAVKA